MFTELFNVVYTVSALETIGMNTNMVGDSISHELKEIFGDRFEEYMLHYLLPLFLNTGYEVGEVQDFLYK